MITKRPIWFRPRSKRCVGQLSTQNSLSDLIPMNQSYLLTRKYMRIQYDESFRIEPNYMTLLSMYGRFDNIKNPIAQLRMGDIYAQGLGVPADHTEAVKWYRKSADQGNADAQYALGFKYMCGSGVAQNFVEAERWYLKSAAQDNLDAMYALGCWLLRRKNDGYNYVYALMWLKLANLAGHGVASDIINVMVKLMTPAEVAASEDICAMWLVVRSFC